MTSPSLEVGPALGLPVEVGGGGGGGGAVRLAQGARVVPSVIPTGGFDGQLAHGAGVLGAELNRPGAAGGGTIVPVFGALLAAMG